MTEQFVKLLLIGDSAVGKSSILTRFCDDKFVSSYYNTIGVDFKTRRMNICDKPCKLQIWDTAGQERFRTITANYYKGSHGILIVFDLTSLQSMKNVEFWIGEIEKNANKNVSRILVGNKCDLHEKRQVTEDEAINFAKIHNLDYIEVSAFSAANVELVFQSVAKRVLQDKIKRDQKFAQSTPTTANIKTDLKRHNKNSSCCY